MTIGNRPPTWTPPPKVETGQDFQVLELLASAPGYVSSAEIAGRLGRNGPRARRSVGHTLDRLRGVALVKSEYDARLGVTGFRITDSGRRAVEVRRP